MHNSPAPRRPPTGARVVAVIAATAMVLTGCVGSVDREEFNRVVRERGGGLSQALVIDAVTALEAELGVDPLRAQSLSATNETVTIVAVSPEFPDEVDRYSYHGGDLDGPEPARSLPTVSVPDLPEGVEVPPEIQDLIDEAGASGGADPAGPSFTVDEITLDGLDAMVDDAIETAGLRQGYAQSLTISTAAGQGPQVSVSVTNERADVTVTYGPDGRRRGAS